MRKEGGLWVPKIQSLFHSEHRFYIINYNVENHIWWLQSSFPQQKGDKRRIRCLEGLDWKKTWQDHTKTSEKCPALWTQIWNLKRSQSRQDYSLASQDEAWEGEVYSKTPTQHLKNRKEDLRKWFIHNVPMNIEVIQAREKQEHVDSETRGHGWNIASVTDVKALQQGSDRWTTASWMSASSENITWTNIKMMEKQQHSSQHRLFQKRRKETVNQLNI